MTLLGARFGTEQRHRAFKLRTLKLFGNTTIPHQLEKRRLVSRPVLGLTIGFPYLRSWRKHRRVLVSNAYHVLQEENNVRIFGKPGELASAVLANVDDLLDPGPLEKTKELFCGLTRESDGADRGMHPKITNTRWFGGPRERRTILPAQRTHLLVLLLGQRRTTIDWQRRRNGGLPRAGLRPLAAFRGHRLCGCAAARRPLQSVPDKSLENDGRSEDPLQRT